jgi:hypothetical protein
MAILLFPIRPLSALTWSGPARGARCTRRAPPITPAPSAAGISLHHTGIDSKPLTANKNRPPCSRGHHPRRQIYVLGLADEIIDYGALDFTEVLSNCDVVFDTVGGAMWPDAPLTCTGVCFYSKSGPPAPQGAQWTDLSRKTGL